MRLNLTKIKEALDDLEIAQEFFMRAYWNAEVLDIHAVKLKECALELAKLLDGDSESI